MGFIFLLLSAIANSVILLYLSGAILGGSLLPLIPIGLELGSELTFPSGETVIASVQFGGGMFLSMILVKLNLSYLKWYFLAFDFQGI